jgi:S-DNA-T family DNA segregation ATPase FtsK/SpoIIIE
LVAPKAAGVTPGRRAGKARQASLDLMPGGAYELPPPDLLDLPPATTQGAAADREALAQNARLLESVLDDFGVCGKIIKVRPGPVVALYELEPAPGTKSSRVIGLSDDIARSMSAISVRVAVIPGRNVIGIELPNARRETVYLREQLTSKAYERTTAKLALALGKDISGAPVIVDLARMPHLLIAGTTGSGKSVALNAMILSLIYRLPPDECKFIMIDPKMLELSIYDGIPHLLAPVVTNSRKAVVALKWTVREMENRYRALSQLGVRNITGYNARLTEARKKGEVLIRKVQTGFDPDTGLPVFEDQPLDLAPLPYIVVVVDEMADLMLIAGKEIEATVHRLSQMARAAGIHLIMATQRPSVDVITGTIKANFPIRISFQVTSKIDSRTILGEQGAEQLLGQGDLLYMAGGGRITRVHGPLVSDEEVEAVVAFLKSQGEPTYLEDVTEDEEAALDIYGLDGGDELFEQAVALVCRERKASTSFIQRHLQIGYNRAARIMERMETEGIVSPANHVGRREVLAGTH